jgi:protein SCO1/2
MTGAGRARARRPVAAAAAAATLLATLLGACGSGSSGSTAPATPVAVDDGGRFEADDIEVPTPRPEFVLTDTEGRRFDFAAETAGVPTLLYFGYTNCPDICPVHLANVDAALDARPDLKRRIMVVLVTVDPARDTPEVIRAYLDRFNATFVGLTGTLEEVRAAQLAAGVPPAGPDADDPALVGHAAQLLGYAADDTLVVQFPFGTRASAYAHDIAVLTGDAAAATVVPGREP